MDKTEELLAEGNCEICKQRAANESVAIGLDLGYHLERYEKKIQIYHRVKPKCVEVVSIYLCEECEEKIKQGRYVHINVLPELKKLIKKDLIKQAILEALK